MGTETDQYRFLAASFLAHEKEHGSENLGYFRSREGREYLRKFYQPLLRRRNCSDGKIASVISDTYAAPHVQEKEINRTKSALRRWREDGQTELWPKDPAKNLRYLKRLEVELLNQPEIREVLFDSAKTVQELQTGHILSNFFYGASPFQHNNEDISYLQGQSEGLYLIHELRPSSSEGPWTEEVAKKIYSDIRETLVELECIPESFDLRPYKKYEEPHLDMSESHGGMSIINREFMKFIRLSRVKMANFMIAQVFEIPYERSEHSVPRNRSTGFAFPLSNNTVHILFSSYGPETSRIYMAFSPDDRAFPISANIPRNMTKRWRVQLGPYDINEYGSHHTASMVCWEKLTLKDKPRLTHIDVDKIHRLVEKLKWNLLT
jgi:hypothetical protein